MNRLVSKILVLIFVTSTSSIGLTQTLDEGLKGLADQITSGMSEGKKQKIAVIEFSDLDGKITEFGKFLSEELITRLFLSQKFNVVERQLLNKVLEEHKLNVTGLIDETTAKQLGKILQIDAICSGTITDLSNYLKVNARLISTETGSIFSVASVQIGKDKTIEKLMNVVSSAKSSTKGSSPSQKAFQSSDIFFQENFSEVTEGAIPTGWIGGDQLIVGQVGRTKALYLSSNSRSSDVVITSPISFPENFRLEVVVTIPNSCWGSIRVDVGSISFGNSCCRILFNQDEVHNCDIGNKAIFVMEKKGNIFTLSLNGKQYHLKRFSRYETPRNVRIALAGDSRGSVILHQIVATKLM